MSQILSHVLFFLMIYINFVLNIINLTLNVVEGPLLRLLHLNHHFLDLFELLETVGLHLLKLLLFLNKHAQASVFVTEEGMFD